jgi:hypothetical protein
MRTLMNADHGCSGIHDDEDEEVTGTSQVE